MHSLYKQKNVNYLTVKLCPNCEQLIDIDSTTCQYCFYNFQKKEEAKPIDLEVIAPLEVDNNLIDQEIEKEEVKEDVVSAPIQQIEENTVELEKEDLETSEIEVKEEPAIYCENCGAKIIGNVKYCGECGARLKKECPECHNLVDGYARICPNCNYHFPLITESIKQEEVIDKMDTTSYVSRQSHFSHEEKFENLEEEKEEKIEVVDVNDGTKKLMKKKKIFLLIQLVLLTLVLICFLFVPILTSKASYLTLIDCILGKDNESLVRGKDFINIIKDVIASGTLTIDANKFAIENTYIFGSLGWIQAILAMFNLEGIANYVSFYSVTLSYFLMGLSLIISYLVSLFGMLIKKPYKAKCISFMLITFLITLVLTYTSKFNEHYKAYDSWVLYCFSIIFIYWIVIKLAFLHENRKK